MVALYAVEKTLCAYRLMNDVLPQWFSPTTITLKNSAILQRKYLYILGGANMLRKDGPVELI
jgi:hypothetical protein